MEINNLLNTGVQGFQQATSRANQAAQEIASQSVKDASTESINQNDLTTSLVDLKVAELDAQANAKVIATASDLVGTLLDVTA
ncbi:flagellar biosynthesis protein FlgE [Aliikangiella coralliicola]|uniref:Flagellar biosynthesis protein FlgE n=1 Tax=Aliikangiella coralliicola TaxID=2592383 RepID=A0A545UJT6_9GAMM|nr:flagellar biosynthesis protein FlgE [Aliikangiella coralliicola]TQV89722.1 flagellar biosynthesis protein FlgE [Aliikangiella coralliicola]